MNHISEFVFPGSAFLSRLTLRSVSGRCEQTETSVKPGRKRQKLKTLWRKIIQQSIFAINGCILLLMRLTFTPVMEPVVSLQKQNVSLQTGSVERLKSMELSHQAKHLTPPSAARSHCNSTAIVVMRGIHKQTPPRTSAAEARAHCALGSHTDNNI